MPDMSDLLASSPLTLGGVKVASVKITPQPGRDRSSGTWELFLMFDDAIALHAFMMGGPVTDPDTEETTYNPTQTLPGWDDLYYSGATVEGIPGPDGIVIDPATGKINYKYATFEARFESRIWGFDAENQGKPSMTAGVEIFTPEMGTMVWQDNQAMTAQPPIVLPLLNVSLPIYNQSNINWSVLTNALANPLNSDPMPVFGNIATKRARYDGSDVSWRVVRPKPVCDFVHHFSLRGVEWDKELRFKPAVAPSGGSAGTPATSIFDTFKRANGDPAIGTSNLNLLFP